MLLGCKRQSPNKTRARTNSQSLVTGPGFLIEFAMRKIPVTKGKYAWVDDGDYKRLKKRKWCLADGYAVTGATDRLTLKPHTIGMHRLVVNMPASFDGEIDHINNNRLDNRKSNLRPCTRLENARNMSKPSTNKSGYKGVCWNKKNNRWVAAIKLKDKNPTHLGLFFCLIKAAKAYDVAAKEHFREFAKLNFPLEQ